MHKELTTKYLEISKEIIAKIENGELNPGDKIPSENELIATYGVSNTTARKSLLEIENRGWVRRIKGKGTFVLNRSKEMHLTRILGSFHAQRESFNENLIKEGFTPKNIILEKTILEDGISANVNNRTFHIEGPALKLHRLRYANDILMKDETRYISMALCSDIQLIDTEKAFLQIYEERYHLNIAESQRSLNTSIFLPNEAHNYFGCDIPLAVFIFNGVKICDNKKVVEIEHSYYRGDKYSFSIRVKPQLEVNGK
jgi:GntR family transcriptional regulator